MVDFEFPPIRFLTEKSEKYGGIFTFRLGTQRAYFISDPEFIKDVLMTRQSAFIKEDFLKRGKIFLGEGLVTSDPEVHRRQRRMIQPAFHRDRIEKCASTMTEFAALTASQIVEFREIDMAKEMLDLTLRIVAQTLFNKDIEKDNKDIGIVLSTFLEMFNLMAIPFDEEGEKLPQQTDEAIADALEKIDKILFGMIDQKRESNEKGGDLLSMLMAAKDSENNDSPMTDRQIRDELITIFLAGHETIANAMTWTWYLLSQNEEAEREFHAEIETAISSSGMPGFADLPNLAFTRKILTESMRLYPPVWALGRKAVEDTFIGNRSIQKGSIVLMSQWVTQRDKKYFTEPDKFLPWRWTEEMKQSLPPFAYFPFGGGARKCIGENFAWMEGILLLATIGRKWRFRMATNEPPEPLFLLTLRPKGSLSMIPERRERSVFPAPEDQRSVKPAKSE